MLYFVSRKFHLSVYDSKTCGSDGPHQSHQFQKRHHVGNAARSAKTRMGNVVYRTGQPLPRPWRGDGRNAGTDGALRSARLVHAWRTYTPATGGDGCSADAQGPAV